MILYLGRSSPSRHEPICYEKDADNLRLYRLAGMDAELSTLIVNRYVGMHGDLR
jgi:hypothetical protein